MKHGEDYILVRSKKELDEESWLQSAYARMAAMLSASGDFAKQFLKKESDSRVMTKTHFLPDERTAMVTEDEIIKILRTSFAYIVALVDFLLVFLRFQFNHYLVKGSRLR